MTFLVAFASSDFALVAGDTRGYLCPDNASEFGRPRGIIDGVRKVYALRCGWLGGSFHAASLDRIAAALADATFADAASVRSRLAAHDWLEGLPPRAAGLAREAAHVWIIAPGPAGFTCHDFNWATGADEDATGLVGACLPFGMPEGELLALLHPFHASLRGGGFQDALRRTAGLFRAVSNRLGPAGSVSDHVEVGALWRDGAGRVLRGHVPPTAAAHLEAATAEDLEGLLLAPETRRRAPQPLAQTAELYALNTKTIKVGTVASPASITRTLRVPFSDCIPVSDTAAGTGIWVMVAAYLRSNLVNTEVDYVASVVMPKGVTITTFRVRTYRETTSDVAVVALSRGDDNGNLTLLKTLTHATTGWATVSDSLTETVGDNIYRILVALRGVSAAANARFAWFEIDYTRPDYATVY